MSTEQSQQDRDETIRGIVTGHARVPSANRLRDQDDLFRAGMTSHATVSVMLALEEAFGVEFSDDMLSLETFRSMASIRQAVERLMAAQL